MSSYVANEYIYIYRLYFFFRGTLFLRKLYLKNFNIENKNNKISQGRGNIHNNSIQYILDMCSVAR